MLYREIPAPVSSSSVPHKVELGNIQAPSLPHPDFAIIKCKDRISLRWDVGGTYYKPILFFSKGISLLIIICR